MDALHHIQACGIQGYNIITMPYSEDITPLSQEVCILELDCTQGSKEIWVALCSLEVLRVSKVGKIVNP